MTIKLLAYLLSILLFPVALPVTGQSQTTAVNDPLFKESVALELAVRYFLPQTSSPVRNLAAASLNTFTGRTLYVALENRQLVIQLALTPYRLPDGLYYLLAQAQIWQDNAQPIGNRNEPSPGAELPQASAQPLAVATKPIGYLTLCKSLLCAPGETVLFFPFGLPAEDHDTLKLAMRLTPHTGIAENEALE